MVWFATLIAVNLQTAYLSPPVAMAAYYLKAVATNWKFSDIYWGMTQFMVLQLVGHGRQFLDTLRHRGLQCR